MVDWLNHVIFLGEGGGGVYVAEILYLSLASIVVFSTGWDDELG